MVEGEPTAALSLRRGGATRGGGIAMEKMKASDIMSAPARCVEEDVTLAEAAEVMLDDGIGSLVVVDAMGRPVGIVTDSDFGSREARVPFSTFEAPQLLDRWIGGNGVERIYEEARRRTVGEIMTAPVRTVETDAPVAEVLALMHRRGVKHVPVLEDGEVAGMIARHDLLKMLHRRLAG